MATWNRFKTSELIRLYEQHKCLYDSKTIHNKSEPFLRARISAYKQIAEKLNEILNIQFCIIEIRKKVRMLRSQYKKELNLLNSDEGYKPNLWCFEKLHFLKPHLQIESDSFMPQNCTRDNKNKKISVSIDVDKELSPNSVLEIELHREHGIEIRSNQNEPNVTRICRSQNNTSEIRFCRDDICASVSGSEIILGYKNDIQNFAKIVMKELNLVRSNAKRQELKLQILELIRKARKNH